MATYERQVPRLFHRLYPGRSAVPVFDLSPLEVALKLSDDQSEAVFMEITGQAPKQAAIIQASNGFVLHLNDEIRVYTHLDDCFRAIEEHLGRDDV